MSQSKNTKAKPKAGGVSPSVMKTMIKECMLDLLENDGEVIAALEEVISKKAAMIAESLKPVRNLDNSTPKNPQLWDSLVECASGSRPFVSFNKVRVKAPQKGVGFQTPDKIKDWASRAYTKVGGEWMDKQQPSQYSQQGYAQQGYSMNESSGYAPSQADKEHLLRNQRDKDGVSYADKINSIAGSFRGSIDESVDDGGIPRMNSNIMAEILTDTALNTSPGQDSGLAPDELAAKQLSANKPLEELFSEEKAAGGYGSWADVAFRGMDVD